ncbi:MAG TPA: CHAD domain-containing protein [Solirubrobacteraceae bacterium]|nr:CHAD domain-containing protein [Solirubrobacteraceae bacterium]
MAKSVRIALEADRPYAEAAALVVRVRAGELFSHAGRVLDMSDIEAVHDMRVTTRRLRAALEIFEPCFPPKRFKPVLRDVKRLADALGERRDPDVRIEQLTALAKDLGVRDHDGVRTLIDTLRIEQAVGNARLAAALDDARDSNLAGRLLALSEQAR